MAGAESPEVLRPRKGKWALVLLVSVTFVVGGLFMLGDLDSTERKWAWGTVIFFGLGTIVSVLQFLPSSSYLMLDDRGLTVRSMWRSTFYRWADIERFGVAEFSTIHGGFRQRHRLVGFDFVASYPRGTATKALMSFNRGLTGFEGALPDNYGRSHAELAAYLNTLRARHVTPTLSPVMDT